MAQDDNDAGGATTTTSPEKENKEPPKDDIFYRISKDDEPGVRKMLADNKDIVNEMDENGMTPLHHAAYKGNKAMCQLLFDYGAEVNAGRHQNSYTALHFAALSGNAQLCQMMLQQGARPSAVNSVNRTAAQMAAFVGNHHCVATINSFVDFRDVEFFTKPLSSDQKPKLDPVVARTLHKLATEINFHPVKIVLLIKRNPVLRENLTQVYKVLEEMSEREMKKGPECSEIVSFKLHMIHFILKDLQKETNGDVEKFEDYIKQLLRPKSSNQLSEVLEILLRRGVREFRFIETTIMHQLVTNLNHTKICEEPGAWSILASVVNGQKGFQDYDPCATCGEERGAKKCARCHYDAYCDQECQKLHWFVHKRYCKQKAKEYEQRMAEAEKKRKEEGENNGKEKQDNVEKSNESTNLQDGEKS